MDSSALTRRYSPREPGSQRVRALCHPDAGTALLIARFASVEVASAFGRRVREGVWRPSDRTRAWRVFQAHIQQQYRAIRLSDEVYSRAEQLVFQYTLRAADALHVASALVVVSHLKLPALTFVTADHRQAQAAESEGLTVEVIT